MKGSTRTIKQDNQPPKNKMTVKALIKIIELYSARKNKANPILPYSTLKPETSSDSASGRSKGARLVSASILTRNIKKSGKNVKQKGNIFWKITISKKFNEPVQTKIETRIKPIDTS
jgi:hypothetical protein|tara:strand:- start:477 stop:827 length:351 start_codon:yes stop_codon:yes gene_type:complete